MASRPIPISNGRGSQRSSPASDLMSPTGVLVSQSLPADVHHVHHSRFLMVAGRNGAAARFQPPLAPAFGSLPAPSFVEDLPMEELSLPPPSLPRVQEQAVRPASVIEFASSCPSDMGYLRQSNLMRNSWSRPNDDFDLSKSPALAAMSAFRDRGAGRDFAARASNRADYSSTDFSIHTVAEELMENLHLEGSQEDEGYDDFSLQNGRANDRRGSYDGGIFDLED